MTRSPLTRRSGTPPLRSSYAFLRASVPPYGLHYYGERKFMDVEAVAAWSGSTEGDAPLVVLSHGWREDESHMSAFTNFLPTGMTYVSLRAPYLVGRYYAWFAPDHPFDRTVKWFEVWLESVTAGERPIVLVGFSAGAAFAGGAILTDPARYHAVALLCGTLPFDAGVSTSRGQLVGKHVFLSHSVEDPLMPHDLLERAWDYLTKDSGATAYANKYECGHEVTREVLAELGGWLRAVTVP